MAVSEKLNQTPLYQEHVLLNARMVPFGGWSMPVQYEGILAEYTHTREEVTIFDISHMGEFLIEGDYKESGLDKILTQSLEDIPVKSSRYGMMLNENGGVIDDLIVFRLEKDKWFVVVNGATTTKDAEHFKKHLTKAGRFSDLSMQTGKIDIQGPRSREALKTLVSDIEKLDYFTFDFFDLLSENVLISRTGYTGELGYEIFFPWSKTVDLWKALINIEGVKPAGLGARDILRLECGYSLYGHELDENISPLESGLKRFIDFKKDFIGKEVLLKEEEKGVARKLVGFQSENRRSPRLDQKIYLNDGKEIGIVTSGTFSPAVNAGIGLGFVETRYGKTDTEISFGDSKNKQEAKITGRIFYKQGSIKS